MQKGWIPELFETAEIGVSSAYEPELLPTNQLAWMKNGRIRGGKPSTRPNLRERLILPQGNLQGIGYFSGYGGMLIASIGGRIYKIRISNRTFSYEEISLAWVNSPVLHNAWMQETSGSFIIQDGQSDAIIYDGASARRADSDEVPRGKMMAYGNGRLWVVINENELAAGDIKTSTFQSELKFTEIQYLTGGGAFYFPRKLTGLGMVPSSTASGYGALVVFAKERADGVRADITYRDSWATMPGFIQPILLNTGAAGHYSIVDVNQDLYWRDGNGGIRNLRSALSDEAGAGNSPISREVSRITDYESVGRLDSVSSVVWNNRIVMTASPFINEYGNTSFRDLISLDFAPLSSMRGKSDPAFDGEWDGLQFQRLVGGEFNGEKRAFVTSLDPDGNNRLWEITEEGIGDRFAMCVGTGLMDTVMGVPMVIEYPRRNWGAVGQRKRLERCDVFLTDIEGEVSLGVYWRADNSIKWNAWDSMSACAKMTDSATSTPHVWKNLRKQERPQAMTFTIPESINSITGRAKHVGFDHQIRLVVRGKAKVYRVIVYASVLDGETYADREALYDVCEENNV